MTEKTVLDKFSLQGKTALVTGGAGLLGKRFTLALAQAGANVMVADLNLDAAQAHAQALTQKGYRAHATALNVTDPESCKQVVADTLKLYGSVDVLVNSAAMDPKFDPQNLGKQNKNAFEHYSPEAWRFTLDINLTGMFLATQATVPAMLDALYRIGDGVAVFDRTFGWQTIHGAEMRKNEAVFGPGNYAVAVFVRNCEVDVVIEYHGKPAKTPYRGGI